MADPGGIEVELKFAAREPEVLAHLEASDRLGAARLGPTRHVTQADRYLDTVDGRLAAVGWACRLRSREGRWIVSLKGPPAGLAGDVPALHRRRELEGPATPSLAPESWPPSDARHTLLAMSAGQPLAERLHLDQQRTERHVELAGRRLGLLSLDRVTVRHGSEAIGQLLIVELELHDGSLQYSDELAAALAAVPGLAVERKTKLERGLAMAGAA